jgi:hypothetical protein
LKPCIYARLFDLSYEFFVQLLIRIGLPLQSLIFERAAVDVVILRLDFGYRAP